MAGELPPAALASGTLGKQRPRPSRMLLLRLCSPPGDGKSVGEPPW
jgi:hypothetical protein